MAILIMLHSRTWNSENRISILRNAAASGLWSGQSCAQFHPGTLVAAFLFTTMSENTSKEVWKWVPGHEGQYQVSNHGRVRSMPREGGKWRSTVNVLKQRDDGRGYKTVMFYRDGQRAVKYIHRLVAKCFIPNPKGKPEVNHLDGDKGNNRVSNLEWCTRSENLAHACRVGLRENPRFPGEKNVKAKLTDEDVREIRERGRLGRGGHGSNTGVLAEEFGVHRSTISRILSGKTWTHVE